MRVLLFATTTGYQLRAFDAAAAKLGIELALATDRCDHLDDPWQDRAIPVKYFDAPRGLLAIEQAAEAAPFNGVLAVGDRPVLLAALAADGLGLPGHPPEAARVTTSKLLTREALHAAGLPAPWFFAVSIESDPEAALARARFPCIIKPLAMAGSRGVVRADNADMFRQAFARVRALLGRRQVRVHRNPAHRSLLVEEYIPGTEYALEGLITAGDLAPLALFEKPDPLEGPYFEETIYITPARVEPRLELNLVHTIAAACRATGLRHGPVHAEARVNPGGVYVVEIAARPIGGLCSRALRFVPPPSAVAEENPESVTLEELLLMHAVGRPVDQFARETQAAGVMMIPVPARGYFKRVEGLDAARQVPGVEDIVITARPDQMLLPWPEGSSYPGFIFARGSDPARVEAALREANALLTWVVDRPLEVI